MVQVVAVWPAWAPSVRGPASLTGAPIPPLAAVDGAATWPMMAREVSTGRVFVNLMVKVVPAGTAVLVGT